MEIVSAEFVKGIIGSDDILYDSKRQVAFIGRSNVGKSSVINSLVGRKGLVKSSRNPGKTRQINFFLINNEQYFVDLPGYGYAKVSQKMREKLRRLIVWYLLDTKVERRKIVVIIDAKVGLTDFDREILHALEERGEEIILIANKFDKIKKSEVLKRTKVLKDEVGDHTLIPYSAKTKMGRKELLNQIL